MTKLIVPGNNNFVVNEDGSVLLKDPLSIQPTANGAAPLIVGQATLDVSNLSAGRTITVPDHSLTIAGLDDVAVIFVNNGSGATANVSDVGYLDEAGDYQTTTTEAFVAAWCVVEIGGTSGTDIYVRRRGNTVVNYTGTAPNAGDFLITSTTAGDAKQQTTMRPEIFAVCTANGAGGTVAVQLLTGTVFVPYTSSNDLVGVSFSDDSGFTADIDAAGSGGLTATNIPYDNIAGAENSIVPVVSTQLAKMRIFNLTAPRTGEYRLITAVDVANNKITVVSDDVWVDNDSLTIESQTVDWPTVDQIDCDLSQQSEIPILARSIVFDGLKLDTGAANKVIRIHELSAFASAKTGVLYAPTINGFFQGAMQVTLIERAFTWGFDASGAATQRAFLRLKGYFLAVP